MSARLWLAAYLAGIVAASFVHRPEWLAAALAAALLAAGGARWRLMRRVLLSVLAFNLTVSLGYVAVAWAGGTFDGRYLLLVNLRVVLMVFLGFWFVSRVPLQQALSFAPTLSFVATIALGQIQAFERLLRDFGFAFASRNARPAPFAARLRHSASQGQYLLERAVHAAGEGALAMRSRGCFDD